MKISYETLQEVGDCAKGLPGAICYNSVIDQEAYETFDLAECQVPEDAAIMVINRNFGFEASRIKIEDKAMAWEVQADGTRQGRPGLWMYRAPMWFAADSNYIRFRVDERLWELSDGELYQVAED